MELLDLALRIVHLLVGAVWLGAMVYSLGVVQPRTRVWVDDDGAWEGLAATLAVGARVKVLTMCAILAVSGLALAIPPLLAADAPSPLWSAVVAAKAGLLVAAVAVFARVSWHLWPARLFAADDELPALRRQFTQAAVLLGALVGANLVLGVVAGALR